MTMGHARSGCSLTLRAFVFTALGVGSGCGRGDTAEPIVLPAVDAGTVAAAALDALDKDGDGGISKSESIASPAIQQTYERYDVNHDGSLDRGELKKRIDQWSDGRVALMTVTCIVTLDGKPLSGATVRLVPEPFLADAIPPSEGTTGKGGVAVLGAHHEGSNGTASRRIALVATGIYQVAITHPRANLPAVYNTATTLGLEVSPGLGMPVTFALSSQ